MKSDMRKDLLFAFIIKQNTFYHLFIYLFIIANILNKIKIYHKIIKIIITIINNNDNNNTNKYYNNNKVFISFYNI